MIEYLGMPENPQKVPSSPTLTTWMDNTKSIWPGVHKALEQVQKSKTKNKKQADKKQAMQKMFKVGDKVYLSTKYLNLRIPNKNWVRNILVLLLE